MGAGRGREARGASVALASRSRGRCGARARLVPLIKSSASRSISSSSSESYPSAAPRRARASKGRITSRSPLCAAGCGRCACEDHSRPSAHVSTQWYQSRGRAGRVRVCARTRACARACACSVLRMRCAVERLLVRAGAKLYACCMSAPSLLSAPAPSRHGHRMRAAPQPLHYHRRRPRLPPSAWRCAVEILRRGSTLYHTQYRSKYSSTQSTPCIANLERLGYSSTPASGSVLWVRVLGVGTVDGYCRPLAAAIAA